MLKFAGALRNVADVRAGTDLPTFQNSPARRRLAGRPPIPRLPAP